MLFSGGLETHVEESAESVEAFNDLAKGDV